MSLKTEALEHWKQNKEWLKQLNWANWKGSSQSSRSFVASIYSKDCPYCAEYHIAFDDCSTCPLKNESRYGCCEEWEQVYISLIKNPTTKKCALNAMDKMIKHIEEVEDVG